MSEKVTTLNLRCADCKGHAFWVDPPQCIACGSLVVELSQPDVADQ